MSLAWSPRALRDLQAIERFVLEISPTGAASLMRRIEATVGLIERYPGVGRRLAKRQSVRVLPLGRYPYRIYYCIENDVPTVLHVRHAARRLPRTRDLE